MKSSRWIAAACVGAHLFVSQAALAQTKPGAPAAKGASAPKPDAKGGGKADPKGAGKKDPKAEPTPKEKAMDFVKSGDKAAAAGDWDDAYAEHSIAWTMYQGWETALGLGKAAAKTGHHAEAYERLSLYLRDAPAKESDKHRKEVDATIADSKSKTGTLTIVAPAGGEVLIDRNRVGVTPLPEPVRVDPGKHEIEIRRGDAGESKTTEVLAGANVDVKFEPPKAITQPVGPTGPAYPWRTPVLITGGTLTVAGLALGGVFLGLSFDRAAAKDAASKDANRGDDVRKFADDEALNKNVMLWSFVGAGVALAGTAAVFFTTRTSPKSKVEGAVGAGPAGPSFVLRGEF